MIETMNTAEIAELLRMQQRQVTDRLIKRPDFPKPWFGRCRNQRLWRKEDVLVWVTQSREAMSSELAR
jgi:hypothetical protein